MAEAYTEAKSLPSLLKSLARLARLMLLLMKPNRDRSGSKDPLSPPFK
jgi:hypothetical protein